MESVSDAVLDETERVKIEYFLVEQDSRTLARDVLSGFTNSLKELPPKHLYDSYGSKLFEQICCVPEYYPTRTEHKILEDQAAEIVALTGACELVELGAGSATKTRLLLDAMNADGTLDRYIPVDVSESAIRETARALATEYPGLRIHGVIGDFERHLSEIPGGGPRIIALLGGTVGNFTPQHRQELLQAIADLLQPDDMLLLGTDLVKEPAIIEAAYDDSEGITAEFNRNALRVMNRELGANFDLETFEHIAVFDRENEWIEMRLRAKEPCLVIFKELDLEIEFSKGEDIRTEISAKFTRERIERDFAATGLELTGWFTDPDELFALSLARTCSSS